MLVLLVFSIIDMILILIGVVGTCRVTSVVDRFAMLNLVVLLLVAILIVVFVLVPFVLALALLLQC